MLFKGVRRMSEYRERLLKEVGFDTGEDSMTTDDWFDFSLNGELSTKFILNLKNI